MVFVEEISLQNAMPAQTCYPTAIRYFSTRDVLYLMLLDYFTRSNASQVTDILVGGRFLTPWSFEMPLSNKERIKNAAKIGSMSEPAR